MKTADFKIHIGLITTDPQIESQTKECLSQLGGGYVHTAKSMVELHQKMNLQKIHLILSVVSDSDQGAESQALVHFFRARKEHALTPIAILSHTGTLQFKSLIRDPRVRHFSLNSGLFVALMTLIPMAKDIEAKQPSDSVSRDWLCQEFETSVKSKLGQGLNFVSTQASDDELRSSFLAQSSGEERGHIGWFKFSIRILNEKQDLLHQVLGTSSPEEQERLGEVVLQHIVKDFSEKVHSELSLKGALFFPSIFEMPPAERKYLMSHSRTGGQVFRSGNISLVLELTEYIY